MRGLRYALVGSLEANVDEWFGVGPATDRYRREQHEDDDDKYQQTDREAR